MGDLYAYYKRLREKMVKWFGEKRMVMVGEWMYYEDERGVEKRWGVFGEEKDVEVFRRDDV
ncbi:hypothetical protein [Bacillus velezensis]|uniref:hypothetical protein n=1 Tax=Bacillus velezensis TaxID=492670 RepID=UPI0011AA082F|nr:hypothetical protein [Bacillus velezensis]